MSNKVITSGNGGGHKINVKGGNTSFNLRIGSTIVIIGVVLALVYNVGFKTPSKKIVGTWRTTGNYTYVFSSNGRYQSDGGYTGTYTIEGDNIIISTVLMDNDIYKFELNGDSLKLYNEDGSLYTSLTRFK